MQLTAPWMAVSTGTPVDNDPDDLRMLLKLVTDPELEKIKAQASGEDITSLLELVPYLETEKDFRQLFDQKNLFRLQHLRQLLKRKMVRQIKAEVLANRLPEKREQTLKLDITGGTLLWNGRQERLDGLGIGRQHPLE